MNVDPAVCALVPMRHASQRVPGKNFRLLGGKPLYRHIVDALIASGRIDRIAVDTDSPVIADDIAVIYPGKVEVIERPQHLTAPRIPMNDIVKHDIGILGGELFLQTHATNPLLKPATIARAVDRFVDLLDEGEHDSLFSVTRRHVRLWDKKCRAVNHDPNVLLQTQDLPAIFEENSCIYLFTAGSLLETARRIGLRPAMFEVDPLEAIDIDEESDFLVAEAVYCTFIGTSAGPT